MGSPASRLFVHNCPGQQKKNQSPHYWRFVSGILGDRWIASQRPIIRRVFSCLDAIVTSVVVGPGKYDMKPRAVGQMISHTRFCCASPLQWRHNGHDSISNHQPPECLLSRLVRRKSKKTSRPRVTGLCAGNSPVTGEFPAQKASNAENVSIWCRHHVCTSRDVFTQFVHGSTGAIR